MCGFWVFFCVLCPDGMYEDYNRQGMWHIAYALVGVLTILLVSEILWRLQTVRGENARKFVHIATGCFVAMWPLFLSWREIQVIALLFLATIIITRSLNHYVESDAYKKARHLWYARWWYHLLEVYRQLNIFHATFDVARKTNGEELYAVGIFVSALLAHEPWIFTLAILTLTLSDGLAAVLGTKYGMSTRYTVFGSVKSWTGNLTFFLTTLFLFVGLSWSGAGTLQHTSLLMGAVPVAVLLTCVEAISPRGSDNVTIPLTAIVAVKLLLQ